MHQVVAATAGQAHQLAVTAVLAQQVRVYGTLLQVTHDLHILAATATVPDIHDSLLPAATAVSVLVRCRALTVRMKKMMFIKVMQLIGP